MFWWMRATKTMVAPSAMDHEEKGFSLISSWRHEIQMKGQPSPLTTTLNFHICGWKQGQAIGQSCSLL